MAYTIYDENGEEYAGDPKLDDGLKQMADRVNGHIVDTSTGEKVYPVKEED